MADGMRYVLAVFLATMGAYPALAQQQPPYEPFSVNEGDYKSLMTYLNTQPLGVVEPIANWLRQKEAEAVEAKKKTDAAGSDGKPRPPAQPLKEETK